MALESVDIQSKLQETFGDHVKYFRTEYDMFFLEADVDVVYNVIKFLKEEPSLNFNFLTDLCGVHYPDSDVNEQFCVVYHLHNLKENIRLRFSVSTSIDNTDVFTATKLFESANWMERETYDFYGINFVGHPNLKRILNVDEMDYFPLRKEFPLEDQTRIDKDDEMFGRG